MEPRFRLPRDMLRGISQIPRINLDFANLPKPPVNIPRVPIRAPGNIRRGIPQISIDRLRPRPQKRPILRREDVVPIPPQDFGFGPGIRPTEIRLPGGGIIGSAGVTPPGVLNIENKGPDSLERPVPINPISLGTPQPPAPVQTTAPAPSPAPQPIRQIGGDAPFAASIRRVETGLDPLTKQLLFGLDGKGGFIPGAMRAAEKVFFDDEGKPVVIEEQVAGLTPDQLRAAELAREGIGIQDRFIGDAEQAFRTGVGALDTGLERARRFGQAGLGATTAGLGSLLSGIGESEGLIRGTLGAYDPSMTGQFYNPFEQQVVQQTISDIMEQGDKQDILARAQDIARGGESAFGSRARLGAAERREALGRGLGEVISGIRSGGFSEAQRLGIGEFARQQQAARTAAGSLANLAGSRMAGQQQLAGALSGLGNLESQIGQQRQQSQFGLAGNLSGLGSQAQAARAADVQQLSGFGLQQQALEQQRLDAQRRNQLQAQQAPLAQYQSLMPFVGMAPAGQFQTTTDFTPAPSPLQAGLATGLGAFGAFGQFLNQGQRAV